MSLSPEFDSTFGSDYLGARVSPPETPVKTGGLQRTRNRRASDNSMLSASELSRSHG